MSIQGPNKLKLALIRAKITNMEKNLFVSWRKKEDSIELLYHQVNFYMRKAGISLIDAEIFRTALAWAGRYPEHQGTRKHRKCVITLLWSMTIICERKFSCYCRGTASDENRV